MTKPSVQIMPNGDVRIDDVRSSFLDVFQPRKFNENSKPKFKGTFLVPETRTEQISAIKKAIEKTINEKWPNDPPKGLKKCFRRPTEEDLEKYPEYEGFILLSASDDMRPQVIDADRTPLAESDGKPYSGCWVNVIVRFWPQDNKFGRRINGNLRAVQFKRDDDAFSTRAVPVDVNEAFDVEVDEEDVSSDTGGAAAVDDGWDV
nr:hypothetical protein 7 [bacterium]